MKISELYYLFVLFYMKCYFFSSALYLIVLMNLTLPPIVCFGKDFSSNCLGECPLLLITEVQSEFTFTAVLLIQ